MLKHRSGFDVGSAVFVDCGYGGSPETEAADVLAMVENPSSIVAGALSPPSPAPPARRAPPRTTTRQ